MNLLDELDSSVNLVAVAIYSLNDFSFGLFGIIDRRRRFGYILERQAGSTASISRHLFPAACSTIVFSLQVLGVSVSAGGAQALSLEPRDRDRQLPKAFPIFELVRFRGSDSKVRNLLIYLVIWHYVRFGYSPDGTISL